MTDLAALKVENGQRWLGMVVKPERLPQIDAVVQKLQQPIAQAHYQSVSKRTGVPASIIAVIHEREASGSWNDSLAQGDPWNRVSTHVPAGRGPFNNWDDAAVDALVACPPYAARNKDWSPGGGLTLLEQYNGLGYAARGRPSPYIWAATNQYTSGKYVSDGVYDPNVVDKQLGCAALLKRMNAFAPAAIPARNWIQIIIDFILSIFRRK